MKNLDKEDIVSLTILLIFCVVLILTGVFINGN